MLLYKKKLIILIFLVLYYNSLENESIFLPGVIFTDKGETNKRKKRQINDDIPDHVTYKIRMEIDNVRQTIRLKDRFWRPQAEDQFATEMRYLRGFIQLQDFVDSAIIGAKTGTDGTQFVASTKQFPFPCHKQDT